MSVSPLAQCVIPSPNHSGARTRAIDTVSIHCMAGDLSVESCGALFARPSTRASSNYGIGSDGRVALYVDEANRSWCTSSAENDDRAVTIEVANCGGADEGWPVSEAAYDSLIDLLTDVCRRNGIAKLLWRGDRSLVGQTDKQNMTVHRWFAQKSCPGDWLYARHGRIAAEVNAKLEESMTGEEIYKALTDYLSALSAPDWAQQELRGAVDAGITDGTAPMCFVPRYQAAIMAARAARRIDE